MRIDPQEFERLKKALVTAAEDAREAAAKLKAAHEASECAHLAHSKAYMALREYFAKCAGLEAMP